MAKLVVILGPTVGLEYPVQGDVVLGRDPRSHVLVSHREVSGQHARITRVGQRYFIEDLGSRNGTLLNGRRVQRHVLADGDEIRVGRTAFRFDSPPTPLPEGLRSTDSGSFTLELDATKDVLSAAGGRDAGSGRQERNLKLLCDVSRKIGTLSGIKSTLDEIAATMLEVFPQVGRVMILLTKDGVSLDPVVTRWRVDPEIPSTQYSETIVQRALQERRAVLSLDALSDDRFASSHSLVDLRLRALMCAPILHREQMLGVVELDTLESGRMFSEQDLNLLTGVVAQVAFAVANAQLFDDLHGLASSAVSSLTTALRLRSPQLLGHSERVSRVAIMMARRLELRPDQVEELRLASLLHDIGFLGLPDNLLPQGEQNVPKMPGTDDTLKDRDWVLLQSHCEKGTEILAPVKPLESVANIVLAHHEHFDGQGYPRGLKGEEIPLGARILAVADVFDAITANVYKNPEEPDVALKVLRSRSGSQFDPELATLFEGIWAARMRLEARRG